MTLDMFLSRNQRHESFSRFNVKSEANLANALARFEINGEIPEGLTLPATEQSINPFYSFHLEQGGFIHTNTCIDDIVDFAFNVAQTAGFGYGPVQIVFDPNFMELVYVDECFNCNAFFTAWLPFWSAGQNASRCMFNGTYYYYQLGGGSDRADLWANYCAANNFSNCGSPALIDNSAGTVNFYTWSFSFGTPLRLGFRIKQLGNTTTTINSNPFQTDGEWCPPWLNGFQVDFQINDDNATCIDCEAVPGVNPPVPIDACCVTSGVFHDTNCVHGSYVSCIAHVTNQMVQDGEITGAQKGQIQRAAALSDVNDPTNCL